jgi:putative DNA primase/helicase
VREGYVEISPSGTGIHIIVEGSVRDGGMRKGKVEMYGRGRFFTITGRSL